jgi:ATP-dependent RNA helicase SUPV3L1/SUV3
MCVLPQMILGGVAHQSNAMFACPQCIPNHRLEKGRMCDMTVFYEADLALNIQHEVNVNVRSRKEAPEKATIYVGPTNSGKTYNALQALFEEYEAKPNGTYIYAGPLRMLAYEVYEKMVDRYGHDNVGFITGEEQINPNAPLVACTVEMVPEKGDSIVLDETHWIVDTDRGQHWTNILIGGRYRNFHILTAMEALQVVASLIEDAQNLDLKEYTRKTPLNFKGKISLFNVPARTAVVCFSRKTVYAVAQMLEQSGKKVGVLYGSLPLKARNSQIEKYLKGDYDIMVTTDVIGHGINLPIDNVVFAQSEKFDGLQQRKLYTWEIAQIAGRAGRFGLSEEGSVFVLSGKDWFTNDVELIKEGTQAGAGKTATDLDVKEAIIAPRLADLKVTQPTEVLPALIAWEDQASLLLAGRSIAPSPLKDMKHLLYSVSDHLNSPLYPYEQGEWRITVNELWTLISGPFNPEGNPIKVISSWLTERDRTKSRTIEGYFQTVISPLFSPVIDESNIMGDEVAPLERSVHCIGELKMANIMFESTGTLLYSEMLEYEDRLSDAIVNTLHRVITKGNYGTCVTCRNSCSPWFKFCEDCYWSRR